MVLVDLKPNPVDPPQSHPPVDYLQDHYPFIERATRIVRGVNEPVKAQIDGEEFNIESVFADPEFFNVFGLKLGLGNPLNSLNEPYTAVINSNTAVRLFGDQEVIGKILTVGKFGEFKINLSAKYADIKNQTR